MTRYPDWPIRYAQFIASRRNSPFEWGVNDCAKFATDCIAEITGVDIVAKQFKKYSTERAALSLVAKHGGLEAIATAAAGEPCGPLMACVGDMVLVDMDGRDMLAICNGDTAFAPGEAALVAVPMSAAKRCWKV